MHTPLTTLVHVAGAGDGLIVGVNEGPPGATAFAVGDTDGLDVVEGAVVVEGDSFAVVPHPAVSVPIPTIAAQPTDSATRRVM